MRKIFSHPVKLCFAFVTYFSAVLLIGAFFFLLLIGRWKPWIVDDIIVSKSLSLKAINNNEIFHVASQIVMAHIFPHVYRISIVFGRSIPVIYWIRELLIKLSIITDIIIRETFACMCVCHISSDRSNWGERERQSVRVPYQRTSSAKLNASKACSFRDACAPCALSHHFPLSPTRSRLSTWANVSWWENIRVSASIWARYQHVDLW